MANISSIPVVFSQYSTTKYLQFMYDYQSMPLEFRKENSNSCGRVPGMRKSIKEMGGSFMFEKRQNLEAERTEANMPSVQAREQHVPKKSHG